MIKLVISDIDGTLIDESEVLSSKAKDVARILAKRSILFSLATGRVESMAKSYIQRLNINIPYVACNGAAIIYNGKVLQRYQVPLLNLKKLILTADRLGMSVIYSIDGVERVFRFTPWILNQQKEFSRYHVQHKFTQLEWGKIFVDKVSVMDDTLDGKIGIIEDLARELPSIYGFTRYVDRSVEVVHAQATKAYGVRAVANGLGIGMDQVLAIGDHQNDIEMLEQVGIGVAVANATPEVKKAADYICQNSYVDGVLEAINVFC